MSSQSRHSLCFHPSGQKQSTKIALNCLTNCDDERWPFDDHSWWSPCWLDAITPWMALLASHLNLHPKVGPIKGSLEMSLSNNSAKIVWRKLSICLWSSWNPMAGLFCSLNLTISPCWVLPSYFSCFLTVVVVVSWVGSTRQSNGKEAEGSRTIGEEWEEESIQWLSLFSFLFPFSCAGGSCVSWMVSVTRILLGLMSVAKGRSQREREMGDSTGCPSLCFCSLPFSHTHTQLLPLMLFLLLVVLVVVVVVMNS